MKNALVVFARAPVPGKVKTRIAKIIGDQPAAELYAAMLNDTLTLTESAAGQLRDCEVVVTYTPDDAFAPGRHSLYQFWNGARMPQNEGDLGHRMLDAIARLQGQGRERVVIIGSDSPDLPDDYLVQAFGALDRHDIVVGKATDGGFYLIGTRITLSSELFAGVAWSASSTLEQVLRNTTRLRLSTWLGPEWSDIDTLEDLQEIAQRNARGEASGSAVMTCRWLASHHLFQNIQCLTVGEVDVERRDGDEVLLDS
jgi:rSAM/selenodomain-associated transferase 1